MNANTTINSKNIATVTFFPEGDNIRLRITGKVFDNTADDFVSNSKVLPATDPFWNLIFGGSRGTKRFMKTNKNIRKNMPLKDLGYENCDLRP